MNKGLPIFSPDGAVMRMLDLETDHRSTLPGFDDPSFPRRLGVKTATVARWSGITVSPDGRWILYGRLAIADADLMVIDAAN